MYYYLLAVITALACLVFADKRLKLVLFRDRRFFGLCMLASVGFFIIWDLAGILLNVFATNLQFVSGIYLVTQDLPVEEFLFLTLFSYVSLIIWRLVWQRT